MTAPVPLVPWSSPAGGPPGWKILLPSRQLASAVAAGARGSVHPAEDGRWPVIIARPDLAVTALAADEDTLGCLLPVHGVELAVRRRRWGMLETLACPDGLPADGVLTVRRFTTQTRMGRLLLALVPVFTAAARQEAAA